MRLKTKFCTAVIIFFLVLLASFIICYRAQRSFFPVEHRAMVKKHAEEFDLDPLLVAAIIYSESRFDTRAVSVSSARGLMQIMPGTGYDIAARLQVEGFTEEDLFDQEINMRFGCYYISEMLKDFDSDITLALAAYNSGPENVRVWLEKKGNSSKNLAEDYPFSETRKYVKNVKRIHWLLGLCNKMIKS